MKRLNTSSMMDALDIKSRTTLDSMVKRGLIAPPIKDEGGCCNYWLESDLDNYLESLVAKRTTTHLSSQSKSEP